MTHGWKSVNQVCTWRYLILLIRGDSKHLEEICKCWDAFPPLRRNPLLLKSQLMLSDLSWTVTHMDIGSKQNRTFHTDTKDLQIESPNYALHPSRQTARETYSVVFDFRLGAHLIHQVHHPKLLQAVKVRLTSSYFQNVGKVESVRKTISSSSREVPSIHLEPWSKPFCRIILLVW